MLYSWDARNTIQSEIERILKYFSLKQKNLYTFDCVKMSIAENMQKLAKDEIISQVPEFHFEDDKDKNTITITPSKFGTVENNLNGYILQLPEPSNSIKYIIEED